MNPLAANCNRQNLYNRQALIVDHTKRMSVHQLPMYEHRLYKHNQKLDFSRTFIKDQLYESRYL